MKPFIVFLVSFIGISIPGKGQTLSVNLFNGYTFQDQVNFGSEYALVRDGGNFGASVEFGLKKHLVVEILYQRQDTESVVYGSSSSTEESLSFNFFQCGIIKYIPIHERWNAYGGLSAGMALIRAQDAAVRHSNFAYGLKAGVLYSPIRRIGLRLQGQLLSTVHGADGTLYTGTGGVRTAVDTNASLYQFGITLGLNVVLSKIED